MDNNLYLHSLFRGPQTEPGSQRGVDHTGKDITRLCLGNSLLKIQPTQRWVRFALSPSRRYLMFMRIDAGSPYSVLSGTPCCRVRNKTGKLSSKWKQLVAAAVMQRRALASRLSGHRRKSSTQRQPCQVQLRSTTTISLVRFIGHPVRVRGIK